MRTISSFNRDWMFFDTHLDDRDTRTIDGVPVSLPHNAVDIPLNYFDEGAWWRKFRYEKELAYRPEFNGRIVSLLFDGVMANAHVYLNGALVASHSDGYTRFEVSLNGHLREGSNQVSVVLDGSENPDIPPFGGRIDYLCYAGIYRDVWLKVVDQAAIDLVKIEPLDMLGSSRAVRAICRLRGSPERLQDAQLKVRLLDPANDEVAAGTASASTGEATVELGDLPGIELWDLDSPTLYSIECELLHPDFHDLVVERFGFREIEFSPDGFLLNGRRIKLRGLNRHQSYPYVGYAMGRRAQEKDAEILKFELGCNLVRTSHYPQSPWFLDHCDRIGLLVFEEIPGWQHVGNLDWQNRALENVASMIRRDWNHPSIVMWGVRINESADCSEFYRRTNALARSLDPTRPTGGVRNIADSEFLEDVYTMNDFVLGSEDLPGANHPRTALRTREEVTGLPHPVPYLITEFNGHMFPTKRIDSEDRQIEHVRRFLDVMNAAAGRDDVAGSIGWCMFDYNTHKDFGSGDRICHHGVLDMYRVPKFAAHAYASQMPPSAGPVMVPVTHWTRGDRSIGGVLPLWILTNCDRVELHYDGRLAVSAEPNRSMYPWLDHPPVIIDRRMLEDHDLSQWGLPWKKALLIGFTGGKACIYHMMVADPVPSNLTFEADHRVMLADEADHARIVVRVTDQVGNDLPYFHDPLSVRVRGAARLIGPDKLTFQGGVAAFWIASIGHSGDILVTVETSRLAPVAYALSALGKDVPRLQEAVADFVEGYGGQHEQ